jgi:mannose-1-phosphate guanylyltransferase
MSDNYYAVIMAGGGGTRLWPLSRRKRPKQMLRLFDDRSLFQTSITRLAGLFPPERIFVVTVQEQAEELRAQAPEIPVENFLLEPMPRGTASVVGMAAVALRKRDPQAVMAVLTADHFIRDEARFRGYLAAAQQVAQDDYLVTLGIRPTHPSTGFGYIRQGASIGEYAQTPAFEVERFIEKPDEPAAERLLEDGNHSWNSGMFIWRVDRILAEFARQMPALLTALEAIEAAWDTPDQAAVLERIWPTIEPETIDYGVMEYATRVAVIPTSGLGWNDVGSWDSLFDVLESDQRGNIAIGGKHIDLDTRDSLVYVDGEGRLVVTIGVEDLVLVDTGDVLLVCHKDQAQRVRQVVSSLKDGGQGYL